MDDSRALYDTVNFIEFQNYTESDFVAGSTTTESRRTERAKEAERAKFHSELLRAMNSVEEIEIRLNITRRWQPSDKAYLDALKYCDRTGFIAVVDELEGRIVQRLFELAKANLAGTGRFYNPL